MELPDGYTARPPRPSDGPAIVRMWNEESVALAGVPTATLDWVTAPWRAETADLEQDFSVITVANGEIVGYFSLVSDPPFESIFSSGGVALRHHGRGLGAAILREVERRAQRFAAMAPAHEPVLLRIGVLSDEPRVSTLLESKGFREARRFWSMRIDFQRPQTPPSPIAGVMIRPLRRGEELAVYECLSEAFQDQWGDSFDSRQRWLSRHVQIEQFESDLWRLAWEKEHLVGALVGEPRAFEAPTL